MENNLKISEKVNDLIQEFFSKYGIMPDTVTFGHDTWHIALTQSTSMRKFNMEHTTFMGMKIDHSIYTNHLSVSLTIRCDDLRRKVDGKERFV